MIRTCMLFILLVVGVFQPKYAFADIILPVVMHPELVTKTLWKSPGIFKPRLKRYKIPSVLIEKERLPRPSRAYSAPYSNIFLQDERMVICYDSCKKPQTLKTINRGQDEEIVGDGDALASIVRQTNVYYWLSQVFDRMESLGYVPARRLIVYVDRSIPDLSSGESSTNNAFFNEQDWSLSFLPSSFSLLNLRIQMIC